MALPQTTPQFSLDDFLTWEATQPERHTYFRGEVYAMAGARQDHVTVSLNVAAALKQGLRGGPCRTFISDMKLRVQQADAVFYPDVMVSCDERDRATPTWVSHPRLVVEVLSDATEQFDRGGKFVACRTIATLQEYVLIDVPERRTEVFRRSPEGRWVLYEFCGDDTVQLASVQIELPAAVLFEDIPSRSKPAPAAG